MSEQDKNIDTNINTDIDTDTKMNSTLSTNIDTAPNTQDNDKISFARREYMRHFQKKRTKYERAFLNGKKIDSRIPLKVNRNK